MSKYTEVHVSHYMQQIRLNEFLIRRKIAFSTQSDGEQSPFKFFIPDLSAVQVKEMISDMPAMDDLKYFEVESITTIREVVST